MNEANLRQHIINYIKLEKKDSKDKKELLKEDFDERFEDGVKFVLSQLEHILTKTS